MKEMEIERFILTHCRPDGSLNLTEEEYEQLEEMQEALK